MADAIQRIAADLGIGYIFKASYDKANRTSIRSFRGPGLVEGARILRAIAQSTGLPVLTDVHTPEDCLRLSKALGDVEAVLQIPAFLCRQTDLLIAAAMPRAWLSLSSTHGPPIRNSSPRPTETGPMSKA